jgi:transcriptional regulator with XRE-family HTH domain
MGQTSRKRHALAEIRRRFRAALAYRGETAEQFARSIDIGANHLSLVLNGHRESMTVLTAVAGYITAFERELASQPESGSTEAQIAKVAA